MRRAALVRRSHVTLLAGVVTLAGAAMLAQSGFGRLVFAETTQVASARTALPPNLPLQVNAAEYSASYARRTLVPGMRGSIAIGDIDGDGQPDLYIVNPGGTNQLLRNAGNGKFRDITVAAKVGAPQSSLSAVFNDYDRSGRQSLFVVGAGGITLYHNDGNGTFSDLTKKAGLQSTPGELYTSAVLSDIDGDGFPDLLISVYTNLDRPPSKPVFTFPYDFAGASSRLYRNKGDGTFIDVTGPAGLAGNPGRARKAIIADFNNDGRPDILILRDDKPPVLYANCGAGKFKDITWDAGDDLTRHAFFDAAVVDLNRDGKLDIVLWSSQSFRVLLNEGKASFERAESMPLLASSLSLFGFQGIVADLDGNGFDDVATVDDHGRVHAFANEAGIFREVPLELPSGFEGSYMAPLGLKGPRGTPLLAIHADGHIALLGLKDGRAAR